MATFNFDAPILWYLSWCLGTLVVSFFANSFVEWGVHRFIMHKRIPFIPYGYEHTTSHHAKFGSDETYHIQEDWMKKHVLFTWREYTLLPLLCVALYTPVELLVQRPILPGVVLAAFVALQMFNSLHWRFHVPSDTWFQKTRFFRYLKEHHRLHHADMTKNFNVHFLPIADIVMGTLVRKKESPAA